MIVNLTTDLIQNLEQVEISAFKSIYDVADNDLADKFGISSDLYNEVLFSQVASCDVLAFNRIVGVGLNGDLSKDQLRVFIERYRENNVKRFFIQVIPDLTGSDTIANLESLGFSHYNNWIKLYREISPLEEISSDLEVKRIDRSDAEAFADIVTQCFGWPTQFRIWINALVGTPNWYHYMSYDGDQPVATAAFYKQGESIWIDFAATLESHRGRGAQSALLKKRFDDAIDMNAKFAVVETAQQTAEKEAPSYRNMIRYGFKQAYVRPNYIYIF